jgi:hypothetical protein
VKCSLLEFVGSIYTERRDTKTGFRMLVTKSWVKYYEIHTHLIIFLGAKFDKRRVYFLVDGATHDGVSEVIVFKIINKRKNG